MHLKLKKSRLTHWWIAESNDKMNFLNIFSEELSSKRSLKVIGYLDGSSEDIARSTNNVVMITEAGVITAQGSFYPFEEAHELYLRFLIEANQKDVIIAHEWKMLNTEEDLVVADITRNGVVEKDVEFDFVSEKGMNVVFMGISKKLNSKVVFATFSRRDVGCLILEGIDERIKADIRNSSYATEKTSLSRVSEVKKILNEITKNGEILVNS